MKATPIINPNSSVPAMNDFYLSYESSVYNDSTTYAQGKWYSIDTEIRSNLKVSLFAINDSGTIVNELPIVVVTNSNGTFLIKIQVPSETTCTYNISGLSTSPSDSLPAGVTVSAEEDMTFWRCHRHDGTMSSRVFLYNIQISPMQPYKLIQTDGASTHLIYGADVTPAGPEFTLPALNIPKDGSILDFTDPVMITFGWDAAANMTGSDKYAIYLYEFYNGEPGPLVYTEEIAGDTESVAISSTNIGNQGSDSLMWFVIATNGDGSAQTETRYFTYFPWQ